MNSDDPKIEFARLESSRERLSQTGQFAAVIELETIAHIQLPSRIIQQRDFIRIPSQNDELIAVARRAFTKLVSMFGQFAFELGPLIALGVDFLKNDNFQIERVGNPRGQLVKLLVG